MRNDEPFYKPNRTPPPPRQPKRSEQLFEFSHEDRRIRCELRDYGDYGVEAQFFDNDEFRIGRRLSTRRALAVQWAEEARKNIEKGGAR